ncbi:MAG: amino acid adenylation domain-containing protein [Candidatus Eremiobacteraeota bacterium]|nr:amino acid adenylation domain-containing protein [Candidatus Eremiobacteraeota bacterium]
MIAADERLDTGAALARWTALVAGASPSLSLPHERPRTSGGLAGDAACDEIPVGNVAISQTVADFAARERVAESTVWMAAFAIVLYRYSNEGQLLLATSIAPDELALTRLEISGGLSFRDVLAVANRSLDEARGACTIARAMIRELTTSLGDSRPAIAHAAFGLPGDEAARAAVPSFLGGIGLGLFLGASHRLSEPVIRYRTGVFEAATIERFAGHLRTLLGAVAADATLTVAALPILSADEFQTFARWNATEEPFRTDVGMVELLREQAARTPDAIAVQFEDATLTYAELDARANRLASYLQTRGVGPHVLVGLLVERSLDTHVAVLGIQRAGGAYIPIDPDYPRDRIEFMLSDSGAALAVSQESLRSKLPCTLPLVSLDDECEAIAAQSAAPPERYPRPDEVAYVIYTSGSTGRPKGVQIEHRQLVNFLRGMEAVVRLGTGDTLVAVAPLAFDISGTDTYVPLTSGARVVVASREIALNPKALIALMERSGVTHMQATPSTWRMLIDAGWQGDAALKILCGGEAIPPQLAAQLLERAAEVWNLYGPTEATIWATAVRLHAGEPITIGHPMANVSAYVLDDALEQVPIGVAGELFLGGAGLARGYLNRAELTAQRFLPDPWGEPGARMYRTGDVARFGADGAIEYVGRADFQVKLRGYRIELGEIEAALTAQDGVGSAVVVVREDVPGDSQLIAYVSARSGSARAPAALRRALVETLPTYMIPDAVVVLDALPLNTNGKIDRSRLPAPDRGAARDADGKPYVAPRSPLESRLVAIWEEILDIRPVGVTDDFFELGASSITAARVFDRIERELGAKLPLSPLFAAPTIERLAALIGEGRGKNRYTSLVPIQPRGDKTPFFWVHGGAGTILHFHALSRAMGDSQPFYGLQMQGLYGDAPPHVSVKAMAAHYIREIRTVQPHGPYAIAGYCFGANVAFEMARQLQRAGERVPLLVTVNGPSPSYLAAHRSRRGRRWKLRVLGYALRARICAALRRPLADAWREETIFLICYVAETRYKPRVYYGSMLLFKAENLYDDASLGWSEHLAHGVDVVEVRGEQKNGRTTMQEPHIRQLSARLTDELRRAFETVPESC